MAADLFFPMFLKNMQNGEVQSAEVQGTKIETILFKGTDGQSVFAVEKGTLELRDEDDPHGSVILVSDDGDRAWVYSNVLLDSALLDELTADNSADVGAGQKIGTVADSAPGLVFAVEGEATIAGETFEIQVPENPIPTLRGLNARPLPGDEPGGVTPQQKAAQAGKGESRQQNTSIQKADAASTTPATTSADTGITRGGTVVKNVLLVGAGLGGIWLVWKLLK